MDHVGHVPRRGDDLLSTELAETICDEADRAEDCDVEPWIEALEVPQVLALHAMIDVQSAFLGLLSAIDYPVDENGRTHDLNLLQYGGSDRALAYCLAKQGWRLDPSKRQWKRRAQHGAVYENACTWVDVDAPDDASKDLQPADRESHRDRPPDVRGLAAQRDGVGPPVLAEWHVTPEVRETFEPREDS